MRALLAEEKVSHTRQQAEWVNKTQKDISWVVSGVRGNTAAARREGGCQGLEDGGGDCKSSWLTLLC